MMTFQIVQDFGDDVKGFAYFDVEENTPLEEIRYKALSAQRADYKDRMKGMVSDKPTENAVLQVRQYGKKVMKNGFRFKIKWR
jgi:hypothetical protein